MHTYIYKHIQTSVKKKALLNFISNTKSETENLVQIFV